MVAHSTHRIEEADVGSGEKPPGQRDTEKLIDDLDKPLPGTTDGKTSDTGNDPRSPGQPDPNGGQR